MLEPQKFVMGDLNHSLCKPGKSLCSIYQYVTCPARLAGLSKEPMNPCDTPLAPRYGWVFCCNIQMGPDKKSRRTVFSCGPVKGL